LPGPGARYSEGHVALLKLVRLLQKQHLPLAEIARRLKGLSDDQVQGLLSETKARRASESGSALDYIRNILGDQSAKRSNNPRMRATLADSGSATLSRPDGAAMHLRLAIPAPEASPSIEPARSQWDRYTLTDGIELNVRRPLARTEQRQLARLLTAARSIFNTSEEE